MDPARIAAGTGHAVYQRYRPEDTLLYQLVERYYPELERLLAAQGTPLPGYVTREFEDYLRCGRLEHGFLRVRCAACHHEKLVAFSCKRRGFCPSCGARRMVDSAALLVDEVLPRVPLRQWVLSFLLPLRFLFAGYPDVMTRALGVVYRCIATDIIHRAGFTHADARTGAVTFIQRFGSALNLNIHFHILFLDGVYLTHGDGTRQVFHPIKAPCKSELQMLLHTISTRLGWYLVKEGVLEQDIENSYLNLDGLEADPLRQVHGHSITYRIAVGPQQGRKVFTLQTAPPREDDDRFRQVVKAVRFSLHAGVATQAHQRSKLERICRYVARPAIYEKRLALNASTQTHIIYQVHGPVFKDTCTNSFFYVVTAFIFYDDRTDTTKMKQVRQH